MVYNMRREGIDYRMGASIEEVGPGDVVKVKSGSLELIVCIERSGTWDRKITTESGIELGMLDVLAYGTRDIKK